MIGAKNKIRKMVKKDKRKWIEEKIRKERKAKWKEEKKFELKKEMIRQILNGQKKKKIKIRLTNTLKINE